MNEASFKQLFLPFHKKLYRIACRILSNTDDAEDVIKTVEKITKKFSLR